MTMKRGIMSLKNFLFVSLVMSGFGFSGCAFKPNSSDEIKRLQDEQEKLRTKYQAVAGVYRGTISVGSDFQYPVSMSLFVVSEEVGKTSDGQIKTMPVLKGSITSEQIQELYFPLAMRAEYREDSGKVYLFPESKELTQTDIRYHFFEGIISATDFQGTVTVPSGLQGRFDLKLQTRDNAYQAGPEKPSPGKPIYDFARSRFHLLAGVYCLKSVTNYKLILEVYELDKPTLVGRFFEPNTAAQLVSVRLGNYRDLSSISIVSNDNTAKLKMYVEGKLTQGSSPDDVTIEGTMSLSGTEPVAIKSKKLSAGETCQ